MPTMKTLTIGGTTWDIEGGVTSVNGQTGAVVLDAADVGAATSQDIADAIIQVLPVDSASGAVASFPDGYPAPVEALSVAIEPVQEGSGDPSPTNVRPITGWSEAVVTDDPKYGGDIYWNQIRQDTYTTLTQDGVTTSYTDGIFSIRNDSRTTDYSSGSTQGRVTTYNVDYIKQYHKYAVIAYSEGDITGVGVSPGASSRYIAANSIWTATENFNWMSLRIDKSYSFVNTHPVGDVTTFSMFICDLTDMFGAGNEPSTVEEFKAMFPLDYYAYNAGTVTNVSAVSNLPYRQITVDLSGTRYGGTLDVLTGVLTVTHKMTTINDLDWTIAASCFLSIGSSTTPGKAGSVGSDNPIICSAYATKATRGYASSYAEKQCGLSVDGTQIIIKDTTYATESALKTAMGTQTLVYELATPTTVQVTAAQLETILGQNNIWANCGDVEVSYRADIQLYIEKKLS